MLRTTLERFARGTLSALTAGVAAPNPRTASVGIICTPAPKAIQAAALDALGSEQEAWVTCQKTYFKSMEEMRVKHIQLPSEDPTTTLPQAPKVVSTLASATYQSFFEPPLITAQFTRSDGPFNFEEFDFTELCASQNIPEPIISGQPKTSKAQPPSEPQSKKAKKPLADKASVAKSPSVPIPSTKSSDSSLQKQAEHKLVIERPLPMNDAPLHNQLTAIASPKEDLPCAHMPTPDVTAPTSEVPSLSSALIVHPNFTAASVAPQQNPTLSSSPRIIQLAASANDIYQRFFGNIGPQHNTPLLLMPPPTNHSEPSQQLPLQLCEALGSANAGSGSNEPPSHPFVESKYEKDRYAFPRLPNPLLLEDDEDEDRVEEIIQDDPEVPSIKKEEETSPKDPIPEEIDVDDDDQACEQDDIEEATNTTNNDQAIPEDDDGRAEETPIESDSSPLNLPPLSLPWQAASEPELPPLESPREPPVKMIQKEDFIVWKGYRYKVTYDCPESATEEDRKNMLKVFRQILQQIPESECQVGAETFAFSLRGGEDVEVLLPESPTQSEENAQPHLKRVRLPGTNQMTSGIANYILEKNNPIYLRQMANGVKRSANPDLFPETEPAQKPPIGLNNSQNMCYANALVQICSAIPTLRTICTQEETKPLAAILDQLETEKKQKDLFKSGIDTRNLFLGSSTSLTLGEHQDAHEIFEKFLAPEEFKSLVVTEKEYDYPNPNEEALLPFGFVVKDDSSQLPLIPIKSRNVSSANPERLQSLLPPSHPEGVTPTITLDGKTYVVKPDKPNKIYKQEASLRLPSIPIELWNVSSSNPERLQSLLERPPSHPEGVTPTITLGGKPYKETHESTQFATAPEILIFHAQRANNTTINTAPVLLDTHIALPKNRLQNKENEQYRRRGFIVHNGIDAKKGHYIAYTEIKEEKDGTTGYYKIDDSQRTKLTREDYLTAGKKFSMAFYEKIQKPKIDLLT